MGRQSSFIPQSVLIQKRIQEEILMDLDYYQKHFGNEYPELLDFDGFNENLLMLAKSGFPVILSAVKRVATPVISSMLKKYFPGGDIPIKASDIVKHLSDNISVVDILKFFVASVVKHGLVSGLYKGFLDFMKSKGIELVMSYIEKMSGSTTDKSEDPKLKGASLLLAGLNSPSLLSLVPKAVGSSPGLLDWFLGRKQDQKN